MWWLLLDWEALWWQVFLTIKAFQHQGQLRPVTRESKKNLKVTDRKRVLTEKHTGLFECLCVLWPGITRFLLNLSRRKNTNNYHLSLFPQWNENKKPHQTNISDILKSKAQMSIYVRLWLPCNKSKQNYSHFRPSPTPKIKHQVRICNIFSFFIYTQYPS